ncbi:MAG: ribosome small subunit-dependent GTPase A [Cytophagaceae bacterium]|jgi:ribosome biogenesis GTPase|nr:ribosome small subunit-dependent GTPase A [Cytophagaceae bacterium]
MKGLIYKSTGSWYQVRDDKGYFYKARLRGKFKQQELKVTNPIAVGDWVDFSIESETDSIAIIETIYPRENYIIRKSAHKTAHGHLIASNLDQSALVVTLHTPRTSIGFIDRFLVSCEAFRIPAILIFNKIDLYTSEDQYIYQTLYDIYSSIGYTVLTTSTVTEEGLDTLSTFLQDKTTLLSGHSGVGKSSLLNNLLPEIMLRTSEISDYSNKGKHTTTFAEMFDYNPTSRIIDTPGIKELGVFDIGSDELSHYFPEMRKKLGGCKFHNCRHINEPGCSIKQAVEKGSIALSRYESYISIYQEEDTHR